MNALSDNDSHIIKIEDTSIENETKIYKNRY
jgi:hypothetical protein